MPEYNHPQSLNEKLSNSHYILETYKYLDLGLYDDKLYQAFKKVIGKQDQPNCAELIKAGCDINIIFPHTGHYRYPDEDAIINESAKSNSDINYRDLECFANLKTNTLGFRIVEEGECKTSGKYSHHTSSEKTISEISFPLSNATGFANFYEKLSDQCANSYDCFVSSSLVGSEYVTNYSEPVTHC